MELMRNDVFIKHKFSHDLELTFEYPAYQWHGFRFPLGMEMFIYNDTSETLEGIVYELLVCLTKLTEPNLHGNLIDIDILSVVKR